MNILIVGNGFDLYHNLPTSYNDFLTFMKYINHITFSQSNQERQTKIKKGIEESTLNKCVIDYLVNNFDEINKASTDNWKLLTIYAKKNFWINHFSEKKDENGGWVDFESEISTVVQLIEKTNDNFYCDPEKIFSETEQQKWKDFISNYHKLIDEESRKSTFHFDIMREFLLKDLEQLIVSFEIYLTECVSTFAVNALSPDISNISFDKILSFNYTDTYLRYYNSSNKSLDIDFIHGKAKSSSIENPTDLVLGIDEYLTENEKNKNVNFIGFKKYYQRIHKETGNKYKEWIFQVKNNSEKHKSNKLFIFGHSLDITDKEILNELIKLDTMHTTIFYHNKKAYGQQIANLVKVLGQDCLIKKVSPPNPTIIFKQQSNAITKSQGNNLEIKNDINSLYSIYRLSKDELSSLIAKIKSKIVGKDTSYFVNQYNIIALYDALVSADMTEPFKENLIGIANDIFAENFHYELYNSDDWSITEIDRLSPPHALTVQFVSSINENNRDKINNIVERKITSALASKDVFEIQSVLKSIPNRNILSDTISDGIFSFLFEKSLWDKEENTDNIWKCVYLAISKCSLTLLREFKIKPDSDSIYFKNISKHLNEVINEHLYLISQRED